MNRAFKTLLTLVSSLFAMLPVSVFAQSYTYSTNSADGVAAAGIGIFIMMLIGFFMLLYLVSFIFWIFMLIHAAQNEVPDKTTWIIVLVVSMVVGLPLVGALVYYFAVKRKFVTPVAKTVANKKTSAKKSQRKA